ncbi:hypothetical protein Nepgr_033642 [Nepenthes gracilis]|uniref:Uncharacterized protein n=1 Tax=Nepenthes gracilis TaxID=150966 RepID=A0AAD3Y734_NEPGR|nr:hypothetical protein Nepgr_033642 [Nepenthes gracilis]
MIYGLLLWSIDAIAAAEWTPVFEGCSVAALLLQCSVVLFGWCCLPVHCDCAELNAGPLWYDGMVGANVDVFSWFWYWSILLSSALCFCRANLCGLATCCSAFCYWVAAVVQQPMAMSCWSCYNALWLLWCGAVGLKLMSDVFVSASAGRRLLVLKCHVGCLLALSCCFGILDLAQEWRFIFV